MLQNTQDKKITSLKLSETYQREPSIRSPSCTKPQQLTMFIKVFFCKWCKYNYYSMYDVWSHLAKWQWDLKELTISFHFNENENDDKFFRLQAAGDRQVCPLTYLQNWLILAFDVWTWHRKWDHRLKIFSSIRHSSTYSEALLSLQQ